MTALADVPQATYAERDIAARTVETDDGLSTAPEQAGRRIDAQRIRCSLNATPGGRGYDLPWRNGTMTTKRQTTSGAPRCLIYARVSDQKQEDEGTLLGSQTERCRTYAAERGWTVVGEWQEVWSGFDRRRPKLDVVRNLVRAGEADVLLCYALDRLSRNQTDVAIIADECDTAGVAIDFVTEDFEQTAVGRFIRNAKAFAAEIEREKIIERTGRGTEQRVRSGKRLPGCRALFGYVWTGETKERLAVNDATAPIVRRIFAEFLDGKTIRAIATGLTADGIPTPTGKPQWGATTVHLILSTPEYAGDARAFRHKIEPLKHGDHRTKRTRRDANETVALPGTVPPLVDSETFAAVQERLDRNRAESPRRNANPEAALLRSGYAKCGYCWHNLMVYKTKTGYAYRCNGAGRGRGCPYFSIGADVLDGFVWAQVGRVLNDPGQLAREIVRSWEADNPDADDLESVERRLRKVETDVERLRRRMNAEEDDLIAGMIRDDVKVLATQKRVLEAERDAIEHHRAEWEAKRGSLTEFLAYCENVRENVAGYSYQKKRDALAWLDLRAMVRAEGDGPRIDVRARINLDSFGLQPQIGRWDNDAPKRNPGAGFLPTFDQGRRWIQYSTGCSSGASWARSSCAPPSSPSPACCWGRSTGSSTCSVPSSSSPA